MVAISGCQLSLFPELRGITQMPFGVETVLPVGPLAYRVNRETAKIEKPFISERFHVTNANKSQVRKAVHALKAETSPFGLKSYRRWRHCLDPYRRAFQVEPEIRATIRAGNAMA